MDFRTLLRASLIPLGAALVTRGLQDLRNEADQLADEVAHRRRQLAGEEPLDDEDQADGEEAAVTSPQEIFRARGAAGVLQDGKSSVRAAAWGVLGLVLGVAAGRAAARLAHREQIVAAMDAGRAEYLHGWDAAAAALGREPAAPGSPADLAARQLADDDEDQADEQPAPADRHACPECGYAPPRQLADEQRAIAATIHRNGHGAGLPGRR